MKRKNKLILIIMIILLCILVVVGIIIFNDKYNKTVKEETKTDSIEVENEKFYIEDTEGFDIKTSYGNLQFPELWKEYINTEVVTKDDCETIQFWVDLEGKDKIHVFDIMFGGEGYKIGSIKLSNQEEIDVSIESYSYEVDDSWSPTEKEILSAVDHDINYLLEHLTSLEGFIPVE